MKGMSESVTQWVSERVDERMRDGLSKSVSE